MLLLACPAHLGVVDRLIDGGWYVDAMEKPDNHSTIQEDEKFD